MRVSHLGPPSGFAATGSCWTLKAFQPRGDCNQVSCSKSLSQICNTGLLPYYFFFNHVMVVKNAKTTISDVRAVWEKLACPGIPAHLVAHRWWLSEATCTHSLAAGQVWIGSDWCRSGNGVHTELQSFYWRGYEARCKSKLSGPKSGEAAHDVKRGSWITISYQE